LPKKQSQGGERRQRDRQKDAARLLCLILAALMLLGCASTLLIVLFASNISAAAYDVPLIRVGIQYGDTSVTNFRTYTAGGYELLSHTAEGELTGDVIGNISDNTVVVAVQGNLVPSGTGFSPASSGTTIGGYRLESSKKYESYESLLKDMALISAPAAEAGFPIVPAYINGAYALRLGCFFSENEAGTAVFAAESVFSSTGSTSVVVAPSETGVTLLSSTGNVLFDYDCGTDRYLAVRPISADAFIKSDMDYLYEGSFLYKRSGSRMTVINVIDLESYVEGVLPYEISSSWPLESQKAFAVASRSYAIGNMGKHKDMGFDMCAFTNCQTYRGVGSVTDTVKRAVSETEGLVVTYNGKVIGLNYSSSTGGCTVSAEDCWGGTSAPYFTAVETPWERYSVHSNGLWTVEVSPSELCEYLRSKGYTTLTGEVKSITVLEYAKNSTYVKKLQITDTSENSVTITNTDKVRLALTKYLKSANFVVGQGSVNYTVTTVTAGGEVVPYGTFDPDLFGVITSSGTQISKTDGTSPTVLTATGEVALDSSSGYVITAAGESATAPGYTVSTETRTFSAEKDGNFVFAGKGWGHGVGLSQYGAKDLADFGYTFDRILSAYSPLTPIKHLSDI